jgi:hypothetical protein
MIAMQRWLAHPESKMAAMVMFKVVAKKIYVVDYRPGSSFKGLLEGIPFPAM